ncbi:DUF4253 domain-containing protein [Sphingosinicella terrae]|uniref:DUF4253 domain-containing protein n=1 Tax=Sphingosinicella terrae TaxID=2172047 RepID=UPI000E0D2199|nr:DUF4253 domain-containing protein [Sphingosinicella terrae]
MLTRRTLLGGLAAGGYAALSHRTWAAAIQADPGPPPAAPRAEAEAAHARRIAALPGRLVTVPGGDAWGEHQRIAAAGDGWPVMIGDDAALERIAAPFGPGDSAPVPEPARARTRTPRSPAEILAAAERLRAPEHYLGWEGGYPPEDLTAPDGEWPSDAELGEVTVLGPTVHTDLSTGRLYELVHILVLPTRSSWEVPAYLRWGGWNACPPPEYHAAALRSWHERYGAELVGINGDTMNLRAARRPETREAAMALARELYRFCPDIVDQGVGTLARLAAGLMASEYWYLWWD